MSVQLKGELNLTYKINPRLFIKKELLELLLKAIEAYPKKWKEKLLYNRKRPSAKGKPVKWLDDAK